MKKGDIVYQSCSFFAIVGKGGMNGDIYMTDIYVGVVIERELDTCGKKQATFSNRGDLDHVLGRVCYLTHKNAENKIFNTSSEAFTSLKSDVVCPDIYSDSSRQVFDDLKDGSLRIVPK